MLHELQSVLRAAQGHAINAQAMTDLEAATTSLHSAEVEVSDALPCLALKS